MKESTKRNIDSSWNMHVYEIKQGYLEILLFLVVVKYERDCTYYFKNGKHNGYD